MLLLNQHKCLPSDQPTVQNLNRSNYAQMPTLPLISYAISHKLLNLSELLLGHLKMLSHWAVEKIKEQSTWSKACLAPKTMSSVRANFLALAKLYFWKASPCSHHLWTPVSSYPEGSDGSYHFMQYFWVQNDLVTVHNHYIWVYVTINPLNHHLIRRSISENGLLYTLIHRDTEPQPAQLRVPSTQKQLAHVRVCTHTHTQKLGDWPKHSVWREKSQECIMSSFILHQLTTRESWVQKGMYQNCKLFQWF